MDPTTSHSYLYHQHPPFSNPFSNPLFQSTMLHRQKSLPVSHPTATTDASSVTGGIRRRLSSVSLRIHPSISDTTSSAAAWALRRSKSVSSIGESASSSIRNWWEWGWGWILSRKPAFAPDLEFNRNPSDGGSWRHVFSKVRSEIRRLVRSDNFGLPQTVRYNSGSYARNFDDGSNRFRG